MNLYALSSGLLGRDIKFIPIIYLAITLPAILVRTFPESYQEYGLTIGVVLRILELSLFYLVVLRAFRSVSPAIKFSSRGFTSFIVLALSFWIMLTSPILVIFSGIENDLKIFFLFLLALGFSLILRYGFFFVPTIIAKHNLKEILFLARSYTLRDPWLCLKVLVAPFGIMLFLVSLPMIASPDGKIEGFGILADLLSGSFAILAFYNLAAASLYYLPDKEWHELGFDHYREGRLATLSLYGPDLLGKLLTPINGLKFLLVGLFISIGNFATFVTAPPSTQIKVDAIYVFESELTLDLTITDREHHFKSFYPAYLRLAGEKGVTISTQPKKVTIAGSEEDLRFNLPSDREELKLTLKYDCTRSGKDLLDLEDLWIWYMAAKVVKLEMKQGKLAVGE